MSSRKIFLVASCPKSLVLFRFELMQALINKGFIVTALAEDNEFAQEVAVKIKQIGGDFIGYPVNNRGINPWQDSQTFLNLVRIFKKEKPDYVLSYTIKPVIYASFAAKLMGIKRIFSMITGLGTLFIGQDSKRTILRKAAEYLYKFSLKYNQRVFLQNRDDIEYFVNNHIVAKEKCVLINGSGVNLNSFTYHPLPQNLSFTFIGRLLKEKGIVEFLKAASIIKRKHPEIQFFVAGELKSATYDPFLLSGVLRSEVHYLGELSDVRDLLYQTTVLVLPSYREGVPRAVLEAMAVGRPIITTDTPGCRETVQEGVNGFLIPPKSIDTLVEKMNFFIYHPRKAQVMGLESRKFVEKKFDVAEVNRVILENLEFS